jgi:hypothetical protein
MLTGVPGGCPGHDAGKDASPSLIDEIVREGTRLLAEALRAEVHAYIARSAGQRSDDGRRLLVRNGYHRSREVLTSAGGHWTHLPAASPIEPTLATVRHRTKVTKGPGSGAAGVIMVFKLSQAAQDHWRSAPHLVPLVSAGARSGRGVLTGRPQPAAA